MSEEATTNDTDSGEDEEDDEELPAWLQKLERRSEAYLSLRKRGLSLEEIRFLWTAPPL